MTHKFVISLPIVDLREEPKELNSQGYEHHPQRLSQLLFGEKVYPIKETDDWLKIKALEQFHFSQRKGWHPYEGWIKKEEAFQVPFFIKQNCVVALPSVEVFPQKIPLFYGAYLFSDPEGNVILPNGEKGTCDPKALRPLTSKIDRKQCIEDAKQFLGAPYLWGGRSIPSKEPIASVDCSGLINLLYRAQGIPIPRDAYPQCLFGKPTKTLLPGDAIYLSKDIRPTHVILKMEDPYFLESPETGKCVRLLKWGEDLWEEGGKWHFKDRPHPYRAFFRYF